jgi:hypothetical protein
MKINLHLHFFCVKKCGSNTKKNEYHPFTWEWFIYIHIYIYTTYKNGYLYIPPIYQWWWLGDSNNWGSDDCFTHIHLLGSRQLSLKAAFCMPGQSNSTRSPVERQQRPDAEPWPMQAVWVHSPPTTTFIKAQYNIIMNNYIHIHMN